MMDKIKNNKSFQVIVGAFCVYAAYRLWRSGVLLGFMGDAGDGYGNAQLMLTLGTIVVDFLQLIGMAAIGVVSGILPELTSVVAWIREWSKKTVDQYRAGADKTDAAFDWRPLILVVVIYFLLSSGKLSGVVNTVRNLFDNTTQEVQFRAGIILLDEDATSNEKLFANSLAASEVFERAGVERRLYYSDQDLSNVEAWAKSMVEAYGDSGSGLLLVDDKGFAVRKDMPSSIRQLEEYINGD